MYTQPATTLTPALVVYLIDASDSMNERCGETTKIGLVNAALRAMVKDMVRRSMRDGVVQRRYRLAIIAYSSTVLDVLNGIRDLTDLLAKGHAVALGRERRRRPEGQHCEAGQARRHDARAFVR